MCIMLVLQGCDILIEFEATGSVSLHDFLFDDIRRYRDLTSALWSLMPSPELTAHDILRDIESRAPLVGDGAQFRARLRRESMAEVAA